MQVNSETILYWPGFVWAVTEPDLQIPDVCSKWCVTFLEAWKHFFPTTDKNKKYFYKCGKWQVAVSKGYTN